MQWSEVGEVHAYLLRHRYVETKPRRRRHTGEDHIASLLAAAEDTDVMQQFRELLAGQGLELLRYEGGEMPGIEVDSQLWMLARQADAQPPQYFSRDRVLERMQIKQGDTRASAGVWFLHTWLMYLAVTYTYINRGMTAASRYQDARFPASRLETALREHCDGLRGSAGETDDATQVLTILTSADGMDFKRRVAAFCEVMVEAGLLTIVPSTAEEPVYQQTLLGAVEIQRNYDRGLALLDPGEDALAQITNLATRRGNGEDEDD
ncbi:hypothetical protein J7355_15990 [Endozoicomonas sp. G2_2]|jgi:hypothetical protein|uniref:hypothetical protein n=1 Tax=Gammaproteobacteria TaxID=1236 RepID=UPI001ADB629E|nr:hypothetical protein [Endozoicomonas sp. G2_2]MBO9471591.1 hypothetical protein [Endozoicomonas sp. G2_2]